MTKLAAGDAPQGSPAGRCRWCRRRLPPPAGRGRPRAYCSAACRQQSYLERARRAEAAPLEQRLRATTTQLEALRDAVDVLRRALGDVERDLAPAPGPSSPDELAGALEWLRQAAHEVVAVS